MKSSATLHNFQALQVLYKTNPKTSNDFWLNPPLFGPYLAEKRKISAEDSQRRHIHMERKHIATIALARDQPERCIINANSRIQFYPWPLFFAFFPLYLPPVFRIVHVNDTQAPRSMPSLRLCKLVLFPVVCTLLNFGMGVLSCTFKVWVLDVGIIDL
jgi:hypothetical protein